MDMVERTMECQNCGNKKTVKVAPEGQGPPRESREHKKRSNKHEDCCNDPDYKYS